MNFLVLKQEVLHDVEPRVAWYNTVYSGIRKAYTDNWAHRGSVNDAPLKSVLDENFLRASIFDVFALVGSVQRIGNRCTGHWL